jgi:hypothetical protein
MKTVAFIALFLTAVSAFAEPQKTSAPRLGIREATLSTKMDTIIIPRVEFRNVTVAEAFEFLRRKSQQLDPDGRGVNFVLKLPADPAPAIKP